MPIIRFTASADTTITDGYKPFTTTRAYYANMGAADSLEMYSIYSSGSETQKSRILVQFPTTQISQSRTNGIIPASGSVNFIFKLFNVEHPETLPKGYYALIRPVSSSWDEGYGLDIENYSDTGQTGSKGYGSGWIWRTASPTASWNNNGGDYVNGFNKQFYFEDGTEDISVDVTNIIESQISGTIPDFGFGISLSGAYEDGSNKTTYYTKRFSARSSQYYYKVPLILATWEATTKDDRGDFYYYSPNLSNSDNNQNIYFYNRINGSLKDLPNSVIPYVKLFNESGSLLTSSIASAKVSTGTYKATFNITGAESQFLKDVWYSGSNEYYTGSIDAKVRTFYDTFVDNEYVISLSNLKQSYKQLEKPSIRVFIRQKDWSPNIYKIASKDIETITLKNLYYKIIRIVDGETIVDYGIDPIAYSKCSYDKNGNYFDFDMSLLEKGYAYGIKFMLVNEQNKQEFVNTFRFKVE